jgi:hypothetical protein
MAVTRTATVAERFAVFPGDSAREAIAAACANDQAAERVVATLRGNLGRGFTQTGFARATQMSEADVRCALGRIAKHFPDVPALGGLTFPWHVLMVDGLIVHTWDGPAAA